MTEKTPGPPPPPSLERRYGVWVWVVILLAFVAGIFLYFRYQGTLAPMFGKAGGK